MKSLIACALLAALLPLASSSVAEPQAPLRPSAPSASLGQIAQGLRIPLFDRRFPIQTCEFKCQEARDKCAAAAKTPDDQRECRLDYSLCSSDCNIFKGDR